MARKRAFDVWFVQANTVYKEVPYNVVADWVQQARVVPDDMIRPSGTQQWAKVGDSDLFGVYVPRSEPHRAEDRAEALQPVELDVGWKRRHEDEDDDVDMIPLIDISLVLLVFFMMTATVAALSKINVPETQHMVEMTDNPDAFWLAIDRDPISGEPRYAISRGTAAPAQDDQGLTEAQLLSKFDERIRQQTEPVEVRVAAHKEIPVEAVHDLTYELEARRNQGVKIRTIVAEVNELSQ